MTRKTRVLEAAHADKFGYPRPQLQRQNWTCLNGLCDFAIDATGKWRKPTDVKWGKQRILLPYAPETPASGINYQGFMQACWYNIAIERPTVKRGHRLILHFGAVDWEATVWVNGSLAGKHEGGYTPFSFDITDLLTPSGVQSIVVRAHDDPRDMWKPRGKQDWQLDAHSIWYPRTTGIWQTVWLEQVPETRITSVRWTPDVPNWKLGVEVGVVGADADKEYTVEVHLTVDNNGTLTRDTYYVLGGTVRRSIELPDPGIDDARNQLCWRPGAPKLIDAKLVLRDAKGRVLDTVSSYTAMRSVEVDRDRFTLNAFPTQLRMALDQGYWKESGMTAPDDAALRRDVELALELGFNGVRKHQKIEDPRFLYWADKLGLMVWEEMPSAYGFSPESASRITQTWMEAIERDYSHPCIVAWVPINESWGVPSLKHSAAQRNLQQALYSLTKSLDSTRPVIGNDGWEMVATDIYAIHDYEGNPEVIADRYRREEQVIERLFRMERPGNRVLLMDGIERAVKPILLTEFGGIALSDKKEDWGYSRVGSPEELGVRYRDLMKVVRALPLLAGYCYTQLTDTYQEANGLLYMDRTPKVPIKEFRDAVLGR